MRGRSLIYSIPFVLFWKDSRQVTEWYFDKAIRYENRLIVATVDYSHCSHPSHVLTDLVDILTTTSTITSTNYHTATRRLQL